MREKTSAGGGGRSFATHASVIKQEDASPPDSGRRSKGAVGMGARRYGSKTPMPFTGTVKRMKHLPYVRHTVHRKRGSNPNSDDEEETELEDPHCDDDEKFGPQYINVLEEEHNRPESTVLRCVYNYEDKYRFSRILSNETLCFDSHFESGNLRLAYRVVGSEERGGVPEYDLVLHNDLHSKGHVQWYYFSVSNMEAGQAVRFNILNFSKHDSFYTQGMRPLLFSQSAAKNQGRSWERCGLNIRYHPTNVAYFGRLLGEGKGAWSIGLHTLSFTLTFEKPRDVCFLAYCYPYTYSDLQRHLDGHMRQQAHRALGERYLRRTLLCKTLAGNLCDLLVITSPCRRLQRLNQRPAVILTGRVHPGESNASYVMKGAIDFLLSSHPKAKALRDRYVFKVVPMLNPDGVVNGNYRTSLAGADLNRRWDHPDPSLHPTIHAAKLMIESTLRTRPCALLIDLHGHSRRQGVFMYACSPDPSGTTLAHGTEPPPPPAWPRDDHWQPTSPEDITEQVRLFPSAMSSQCPAFDPSSCRSSMHVSKASTMRVVLYTTHLVYNAYTLETSLAGAHGRHFTPRDLEKVGVDLCLSILPFRRSLGALQHAHTHELRQLFQTQLGEGSALDVPPTLSPAPSTVSHTHTYASSVGFLESPTRLDEGDCLAAPSSFPPSSPPASQGLDGPSAPHPTADAVPPSVGPSSAPPSGLLPSLLSPLLPLTPRRIYHLPFARAHPHPGSVLEEQPSEGDVMCGEGATLVLDREESSGSDSDPSGDNLGDSELAENMKRAGLARVAKGLMGRSPSRTKLPGSEKAGKEGKGKLRHKHKKHHRRRHTTGDMPDLSGLSVGSAPLVPQASPNKRYGTQGGRHLRTASQGPACGTPAEDEEEEDTVGSVCTDGGSHHSHLSRQQHNQRRMVGGLAQRIRLAPRRPGRSSSSSDKAQGLVPHAPPEPCTTAPPVSPLSSRSSATAGLITIPSCLPAARGSTGEGSTGTCSSASLRRTFSEPAAVMTVGTSQHHIVDQWQHALSSQRQPNAPPAPYAKAKPSTATTRRKTTYMPRTVHPSSHSQAPSGYWERQHVLLRLAPPPDPPAAPQRPPPALERPRHAAQTQRPEVEDETFAERRFALPITPAATAPRLPPPSTRQARLSNATPPAPRHATPAAPFLPLHHPSDRRAARPRIKPPHVATQGTRKSGRGPRESGGVVSQRGGAQGTGGPPGNLRKVEMGPLIIKPAA